MCKGMLHQSQGTLPAKGRPPWMSRMPDVQCCLHRCTPIESKPRIHTPITHALAQCAAGASIWCKSHSAKSCAFPEGLQRVCRSICHTPCCSIQHTNNPIQSCRNSIQTVPLEGRVQQQPWSIVVCMHLHSNTHEGALSFPCVYRSSWILAGTHIACIFPNIHTEAN